MTYKKTVKKIIEGWIGYDNKNVESSESLSDILLERFSSNCIFETKEAALRTWDYAIRIRVIVEKMIDGEEEKIISAMISFD